MIALADQSLWTPNAAHPLALLALFAACTERRHALVLLPPRGRDAFTRWMDAYFPEPSVIRPVIEQVVDNGLRKAANGNAGHTEITVAPEPTDWASARVSPNHAVQLLLRPLRLLVENRRNDAAFLRLMAEPAERRNLDEALQRGWVEFEMGGGITEMAHRLRALAATGPADEVTMIERARTWVMFDRDAHPDDRSQESADSRTLRELAAQVRTPWPLAAHQLERRAIENYVPAEVLRGWWCAQATSTTERARRTRLVKAFLTPQERGGLSSRARRHYNMKRGLLGDVKTRRREEIHERGEPMNEMDLDPLFRGLDPQVRDVLAAEGGFKGVGDAFSAPGVVVDNTFFHEVDSRERRRLLSSLFSRM